MHGDKIILAARLMQLASKLGGMVLCDEATHEATCDEIRFVQLRPVELKGMSAPMQVTLRLEPSNTASVATLACTPPRHLRHALS